MKILYVTTIGATMGFFKSIIKELVEDGNTVDIACNEQLAQVPEFYSELGCSQYHLDCTRSPFDSGNIKCIKQIKQLVEENGYDVVHCHTPIVAFCTRLACRCIRKKRARSSNPLRVFYTAHGFHFYKGAPKKNWIIFYPIEKLCARWTDTLITINNEDYNLAKNKFEGLGKSKLFQGCRVEYVPGVGVDVEKFANTIVDKKAKRAELGIPEDAFLLLSVGELNENKNHQVVIRALAELMKTEEGKKKDYYYIVAGSGSLYNQLQKLINDLGLNNRVFLLGYRADCAEIYKIANLFVQPSLREGLPVSVMEAESAGLACIGSGIRGNSDLIVAGNLFSPRSVDECIEKILCYPEDLSDMNCYGSAVVNESYFRLYNI